MSSMITHLDLFVMLYCRVIVGPLCVPQLTIDIQTTAMYVSWSRVQ